MSKVTFTMPKRRDVHAYRSPETPRATTLVCLADATPIRVELEASSIHADPMLWIVVGGVQVAIEGELGALENLSAAIDAALREHRETAAATLVEVKER